MEQKYFQLFGLLKMRSTGGSTRAARRFPEKMSWPEKYGMSRQTVRQALSLLEQESLIERRQGQRHLCAGERAETETFLERGRYDPLISANTSSPLF